jgi:hypothetical protein
MHTLQEGGAPEGAIPGLSSWIAFLETSILDVPGETKCGLFMSEI